MTATVRIGGPDTAVKFGNGVVGIPSGSYAFVYHKDGNLVVGIHDDGSVVLGPDITLDEASKAFWNNVAANRSKEID